jgi:hypothetical protein
MKRLMVLVFLFVLVFSLACSGGASDSADSVLFAEKCALCHPLERGEELRLDKEGWAAIVERMKTLASGLISDEDGAKLIDHLVRVRGPK